jgi:hypothetical protein
VVRALKEKKNGKIKGKVELGCVIKVFKTLSALNSIQ